MKQGSNNKRPRRGGAPKGNRGPVRNQTFDSNGPGIRVRGNAQQVMEKYLALARDAVSAGDRILAENYYQHAEHYFRIANVNGALTQRVQQGGLSAQQTPASDHNALDDLFEYEEEAALQQVNGGHGGDQRDYQQSSQQQYRHGRDDGDEDDGDGDGADTAEVDAAGDRQDGHGERQQGRSRRQRGRRGGRDRGERHEGGEEQPSLHVQPAPAPAQVETQPQPQPQPESQPAPAAMAQPVAAAEAPAAPVRQPRQPRAPRQDAEPAAEPDAKPARAAKAGAAAPAPEGSGEGEDAAPRRRRRTTTRKTADKAEEAGSEAPEPREAVA